MKDAVANRAVFERYLTEREERQLFKHIAQFESPLAKRDLAWMRLLRQTGIRVGSLARLTIWLAQDSLSHRALRVLDEIAKGERGYTVPLNSEAERALRDLLRVRRAMGEDQHPDSPLILSTRGRALSIRSFQAISKILFRS